MLDFFIDTLSPYLSNVISNIYLLTIQRKVYLPLIQECNHGFILGMCKGLKSKTKYNIIITLAYQGTGGESMTGPND